MSIFFSDWLLNRFFRLYFLFMNLGQVGMNKSSRNTTVREIKSLVINYRTLWLSHSCHVHFSVFNLQVLMNLFLWFPIVNWFTIIERERQRERERERERVSFLHNYQSPYPADFFSHPTPLYFLLKFLFLYCSKYYFGIIASVIMFGLSIDSTS